METGDLAQLSEELIRRLGSGGGLDGMMGSEFFDHQENIYMQQDDEPDDEDNEPDDVIILHMDIREPLSALQKLVEKKLGIKLTGYKFWLQDAQELEPHKNLVDQCVKGEGLVQINVQIRTIEQRINIVDVLKPTEAALAAIASEEDSRRFVKSSFDDCSMPEVGESQNTDEDYEAKSLNNTCEEKPCQNWVLDHKFKKEQARLKIPEDPNEWTVAHVQHWFQWAIRQFDLMDFKQSDWSITGNQLCALTHQEFRQKLPRDPGNVFWTHLQLLKECKFVSVVHKLPEEEKVNEQRNMKRDFSGTLKEPKIMRKSVVQSKNYPNSSSEATSGNNNVRHNFNQSCNNAFGMGSGNNGQMQLWQFLLEILTDREHVDIIQWVGTEGEFKLTNPEQVARLWGIKKNKPAMNYEKLSRALRYYYDGDMISKVSGKRFAYKFDCDLKLLIGYNAAELAQLVNEKPFLDESIYLNQIKDESDDE